MKLSTLLFFLFCSTVSFGQTPVAESTGDVTDIQVIQKLDPKSAYVKIWQPYIAVLDSQTYIATWGLVLKGKTDMGDIECSVSKDKGKTWSYPITIFNS